MPAIRPSLRSSLAALFAASAVFAGCQSSTHPTMLPEAMQQTLRSAVSTANHGAIESTCATSISIINPQPIKCNFSEQAYTGRFSIDAKTLEKDKIASVAPKIGTSKTVFSISAGTKPGFGSFLVSAQKGETLEIAIARLQTARSAVCVHPATSSQNVALPSTGGVSARVSFTPFAASATGCDYVKISTGADMEITRASERFARDAGIDDASEASRPLLTISVGEGFDGHPIFGNSMIVSGMQLMVSPDLHFPDGTYYATVTTASGGRSRFYGAIPFTAKDGILKVANITLPNGKPFPLIFTAHTSSIITLYPRGAVPPEPSPSPTPSTSPTPSGTPSPKPTPFPTSKPCKGCYGEPPPAEGAEIGTSSYDIPVPPCTGVPAPCSGSSAILQSGDGLIYVPGGMAGAIVFSANIGYMRLLQVTNNCPKDWLIDAGLDGSGAIVIPNSHPFVNTNCAITYSTLPPGKHGFYYTETLSLFGID